VSHGSQLEQRSFGPQAEQTRLGTGGIDLLKGPLFVGGMPVRAKLTIGEPNDKYEQEADRVAEQVMSMPDGAVQGQVQREELEEDELQMKPLIQRQGLQEEDELQMKPLIQRQGLQEEDELQMKADSSGQATAATGEFEAQLNSSKGGGIPLSEDVRSFMEPRFGADFSRVRVHTGSEAVQMNREVGAQAFAHGQDVYFGAGKGPGKDALTAHELTHVVQQSGSVRTKSMIMRQDAGTLTPAIAQPTDAGLVAGVPSTTSADLDNLPEDLRTFLTHGLFGPQALVPPTNIGGFDASYNPPTGRLLIQVNTGANFNDGLSIDGTGTIIANHSDLAQAAIDGMTIPDVDQRQAFVTDFVWNDEQKQTFITDLQSRVEGAWSSSATGLAFTCTRPGWESVIARATVDVDVHEGSAGASDHLQTTVYKVPDSGTYSVGAFVDSDRNDPDNARDQDAHNNELVMSSTDVNPTPESQSLLQKSVQFGHNSAVLSVESKNTLSGFAADFQDANLDLTNPVQLVGRASSSGSEAYNLQLAQRRIDAVRNFLSSVGFTGINDRISTDNQGEGEAAEAPEWRRVDLIVGSGEGQLVASHEFGHVFGLDDEYVSDDVNPGGTISGSGKAVGTAVDHDQMAHDIGTSGAIAENNDGIMSLGNTIRGQHYATFGWALGQVTGVTEWQVG
jgi:outer membrane protein OmpA-like peptidoglycan-associated protein